MLLIPSWHKNHWSYLTDRCFGYKVHISFSKEEQVLPVRTQILKENEFLALLQWQEKFLSMFEIIWIWEYTLPTVKVMKSKLTKYFW